MKDQYRDGVNSKLKVTRLSPSHSATLRKLKGKNLAKEPDNIFVLEDPILKQIEDLSFAGDIETLRTSLRDILLTIRKRQAELGRRIGILYEQKQDKARKPN
jgi:hypothetical protein